jgi:uncharacterized ferritin-like protein (DUF455 family)
MQEPLDPELFAENPERDSRFSVKDVWTELANIPPEDPAASGEFLHRQMNEEINGLEISARNLADFPAADWELRMAIARQCWDEARHIEMFRHCFEKRGVRVGQYPVMNFQYRILTRIDSLIGRLTVQNRSFEAAGIDAIQSAILDASTRAGETDLVELFDGQLADEVQHVRYANVWVDRLKRQGGPRTLLDLARAVSAANRALLIVAGGAATSYPIDEELRREAGFTEEEIEAARALLPGR